MRLKYIIMTRRRTSRRQSGGFVYAKHVYLASRSTSKSVKRTKSVSRSRDSRSRTRSRTKSRTFE